MGNIESSQNKLKLRIINNKREAQHLLDHADNYGDFYIPSCHNDKSNSIARRNLSYVANSVSEREKTLAESFITSVYAEIPERLLMDLEEVKIIQLMPTADDGMPHTRAGNIICYPDFSILFSKTTLIHELWHIHQRIYSELWEKAFKRIGWEIWDGELPEALENNRRYNPDTIDSPLWIFNKTWIPIPIFRDISRPSVADVDIWFYNPEKQYHIKHVPQEIESYFTNLPAAAYEHPRELAAYMLSEHEKYTSCIGFKHLIESIGQLAIITK